MRFRRLPRGTNSLIVYSNQADRPVGRWNQSIMSIQSRPEQRYSRRYGRWNRDLRCTIQCDQEQHNWGQDTYNPRWNQLYVPHSQPQS